MKKNKRRNSDSLLNLITYLSSGISVIMLLLIFTFIFSRGAATLSWKMFTSDYWAQNYQLAIPSSVSTNFTDPNLGKDVYFSTKYGIAVKDGYDAKKEPILQVVYLDPLSPFTKTTSLTLGNNFGTSTPTKVGMSLIKVGYLDNLGQLHSAGPIIQQKALEFVQSLDNSSSLQSAYAQTSGGGIRGSLIATLYLILISLLIALPIGIMTAVYLNDYARFNKSSQWIRSSIDLLTGVPSIIFGLMGMVVLYPITTVFKASGTSILLGGLTMSVILLPIIIRTTEEALKVVPDGYRDASLSLGANRSQTVFKIVLPQALPGIITGVLLSVGRVIGESAALIYTMGTFVNDAPKLTSGGTSLAVQIWSIMSSDQPNFALASAISIIILMVVLTLNIGVKLIIKSLDKTA
jgi:phosphate transport system permease protein